MSDSNKDEMKGRAKEAVGSITDDDEMRREGRNDQRAADLKKGVERAGEKAKDAIDKIRDR